MPKLRSSITIFLLFALWWQQRWPLNNFHSNMWHERRRVISLVKLILSIIYINNWARLMSDITSAFYFIFFSNTSIGHNWLERSLWRFSFHFFPLIGHELVVLCFYSSFFLYFSSFLNFEKDKRKSVCLANVNFVYKFIF